MTRPQFGARHKAWIVICATAATVGVAASLASAEPGLPEPSPAPEAAEHGPVNAVVDALMRFDDAPGFSRVEVDYASSTVTVYWKGEPEPEVLAALGKNTDGVLTVLRSAKFTRAEFDAAGERILATENELGRKRTIMGVMPNDDLSGVIVQIRSDAPAWDAPSETAARLADLVGMPVSLQKANGLVLLTRQNDSAPWQGGGALADSTGDDYCSNGFAVLKGEYGYLLSDQHCFVPAGGVGAVVRDGVGQRIGVVSNSSKDGDTALIDPDASPATIGKVFGGPWNASTSHARYQFFLAGGSNPAENQDICTSGARSGEHCNATAQNTGKTFDCAYDGNGTCHGFEVTHDTDGVVGAAGDSGGPVYYMRTDGRVRARGIIVTANSFPVTCGSVAEPTTCYSSINATNIEWILNK